MSTAFMPWVDMGLAANFNYTDNVLKSERIAACTANGVGTVRLAFVTGTSSSPVFPCGSIAGYTNTFAALETANIKYIIGFGGVAASFTITDYTSFSNLVNSLKTDNLVGLDFDMETTITAQQQTTLLQNIKQYQQDNPDVPIIFTLPVLASAVLQAPDPGEPAPYNILQQLGYPRQSFGGALPISIMLEAITLGIDFYSNPMVMDFGTQPEATLVNSQGVVPMNYACNTAIDNVVKQLVCWYARNGQNISGADIYKKMCATYMLGHNDTAGNIFYTTDIPAFCQHALNSNMFSVSYWEISRDNTTSSSVPQTDYQFMHDTQLYLGNI